MTLNTSRLGYCTPMKFLRGEISWSVFTVSKLSTSLIPRPSHMEAKSEGGEGLVLESRSVEMKGEGPGL